MANINKACAFIRRWEGGYSDHPSDKGGCTMAGVTLATYRRFYGSHLTCADLLHITAEQWAHIFRVGYWDKIRADQIENDSVATLCADWVYMSGTGAIKRIQKAVGVEADGVVGRVTLAAINKDPYLTFVNIVAARERQFYDIVARNPSQRVFLRGWLNRLHSHLYTP